jgi:hypothetical protein
MKLESKSESTSIGLKSVIVAFLAIGLVGAGGGVTFRMMLEADEPTVESMAGNTSSPTDRIQEKAGRGGNAIESKHAVTESIAGSEVAEENESNDFDEPPDKLAEMIVTPMDPIITNIKSPAKIWVRLEGSIMSRTNSEVTPEILAAQTAHQVLSYLRTLEIGQFEGSVGLLHINEDINDIAKTISDGTVRQILITGLIVE